MDDRTVVPILITTLAAAVTFFLNGIWTDDSRWLWTGLVISILLIVELIILAIVADEWGP